MRSPIRSTILTSLSLTTPTGADRPVIPPRFDLVGVRYRRARLLRCRGDLRCHRHPAAAHRRPRAGTTQVSAQVSREESRARGRTFLIFTAAVRLRMFGCATSSRAARTVASRGPTWEGPGRRPPPGFLTESRKWVHTRGDHGVGYQATVARGCSSCDASPGGGADRGARASARRHGLDHRCRARGSRRRCPTRPSTTCCAR